MALLTKRYILLAKIESTYNVDASPINSTNGMVVEELKLEWPTEVVDGGRVGFSISPRAPIHGRKYGKMTFNVRVAGSGGAGIPADWGPLLEACGFDETIVGGTSVTYDPMSPPDIASVTIYANRDGLLYKFTGCRGNVKFDWPAGKPAMMTFEMWGHAVAVSDDPIQNIIVDSTVAPVVINSSFTIGSYAAVISSLSIDMQNDMQMTDSVNGADGYAEAAIVGRNALGTMDPEATLVATRDWWSKWEDGTQEALSIVIGVTAGNIATFTAPKCTHRELVEGDRNGILTYDIPFTCAGFTGDDEVSLVMT
jgi:hypothetical protein